MTLLTFVITLISLICACMSAGLVMICIWLAYLMVNHDS